MKNSLKSKVFSTGVGAWNNRWYVYVGAPFLAALGVVIGSLWGVHLASTELGEALVVGLFVGVTMIVGFTILALIDQRR